jgi:hypothetical protein
MATLMNLLALVLFTLPTALAPQSPAAAPAAQAPQQRPPDLEAPVDEIVAWLRNSQDRVSGCYAGGVEGTSWVLRALADCRRKYRRIDGPFVSKALDALAARQDKDGSIHDPGASPEAVRHAAARKRAGVTTARPPSRAASSHASSARTRRKSTNPARERRGREERLSAMGPRG